MSNLRCLNLIMSILFFYLLGCSPMSAWRIDLNSSQGAWPEGPATVPNNPADLDSGILTPFSRLSPEREVWVASYGRDTGAGTLFEPKRTVSAALLIATPGTAIMVKAGVYRENLRFDGPSGNSSKPIWIRSADGKGAAELAALSDGEALVLTGVSAVIVEGFRINFGIKVEGSQTRESSNIVIQNNIITNGFVDGIRTERTTNLFIIANDISASPRGQGIQITSCRNVLVADNYIHDLRTNGTKNDGVNLKGDTRDVMIQNNIVERIDGTALVLEGINITARANTLTGNRRATTFSGCESCALERNNLNKSGGLFSDVGLIIGDSPQYPTANIRLTSNCVYRTDWLYVEAGTSSGLVNVGNAPGACL